MDNKNIFTHIYKRKLFWSSVLPDGRYNFCAKVQTQAVDLQTLDLQAEINDNWGLKTFYTYILLTTVLEPYIL